LGTRNSRKSHLALAHARAAGPSDAPTDEATFLMVSFDVSEDPREWISASSEFTLTALPASGEVPLLKATKGLFRKVQFQTPAVNSTSQSKRPLFPCFPRLTA
jgi:hypothetical protein